MRSSNLRAIHMRQTLGARRIGLNSFPTEPPSSVTLDAFLRTAIYQRNAFISERRNCEVN